MLYLISLGQQQLATEILPQDVDDGEFYVYPSNKIASMAFKKTDDDQFRCITTAWHKVMFAPTYVWIKKSSVTLVEVTEDDQLIKQVRSSLSGLDLLTTSKLFLG
jgi:hypothetical protein